MARCQEKSGSLDGLAMEEEEEEIVRIKFSIKLFFDIRKLVCLRLDSVDVVESWREREVRRLSQKLYSTGINDWGRLTSRIKLYCW